MNPPQHSITYKTDNYPTSLKTHHEMSEAVSGGLSAERIMELADSGYMPHYRIDGGIPLFKVTEVKAWISQNARPTANFFPTVFPTVRLVSQSVAIYRLRSPYIVENIFRKLIKSIAP